MSRYHRQTILPDFGPAAEERLAASHAMIIGLGALGCPAADLLARAGVGTLSLVDRDIVELTNLQRQSLYDERDAAEGAPKAEAAARRLRAVNSSIRIHALVEDFAVGGGRGASGGADASAEAERIVLPHPRPHILLDCTDNFETRYLINDICVKHAIPYVYGGAVASSGMAMTVLPGVTPCLRCLFPDPPEPGSAPTCDTAGILGPVAAIVGACQAIDALKLLIGRPDRLSRTLLSFDAWSNQRRRLDLSGPDARRADCPCCALRRFEFLAGAAQSGHRVLCGRNSVQITPARAATLDLAALGSRLAIASGASPGGMQNFTLAPTHLKARVDLDGAPFDLTIFPDGRAIIGGATDPAVARGVYAKFIGA